MNLFEFVPKNQPKIATPSQYPDEIKTCWTGVKKIIALGGKVKFLTAWLTELGEYRMKYQFARCEAETHGWRYKRIEDDFYTALNEYLWENQDQIKAQDEFAFEFEFETFDRSVKSEKMAYNKDHLVFLIEVE